MAFAAAQEVEQSGIEGGRTFDERLKVGVELGAAQFDDVGLKAVSDQGFGWQLAHAFILLAQRLVQLQKGVVAAPHSPTLAADGLHFDAVGGELAAVGGHQVAR